MDQGKYRARATRHSFGIAKTGTEYVAVEFELLDDDEKRTIVWRGYFHAKTAERTLEALRYAGAALEDDDIFDLRGLGSTEVQLVVELEAGERRRPDGRYLDDRQLGEAAVDDRAGPADELDALDEVDGQRQAELVGAVKPLVHLEPVDEQQHLALGAPEAADGRPQQIGRAHV